jgi:hypothetical protein
MTEEQIDILERLVEHTLYKSMHQLRRRIRDVFVDRGWKEDLKKFKLIQDGDNVHFMLNPRYMTKDQYDL